MNKNIIIAILLLIILGGVGVYYLSQEKAPPKNVGAPVVEESVSNTAPKKADLQQQVTVLLNKDNKVITNDESKKFVSSFEKELEYASNHIDEGWQITEKIEKINDVMYRVVEIKNPQGNITEAYKESFDLEKTIKNLETQKEKLEEAITELKKY